MLRGVVCSLPLLAAALAVAGLPVIDPGEVIPGEAGVCVTEMDGGERVEIPLRVLGVLDGSAPERELILVRLEGERYETTGIVAGMSGSPVYVRGRLLGALAFGWSFAKEPIGGVTPAGRMLELAGDRDRGGPTGVASKRPEMEEMLAALAEGRGGRMLVDWLLPESRGQMQHVPVAVASTASPPEWIAEAWTRLGWVSAPAGRLAAGAGEGSGLEPGSMMAVLLAEGDATVAAGGTVTMVDGTRVWGFGHPYLGGGDVSLPLARAKVIAILPSVQSSFKMFGVGETVGAITRDATHGVFGELGAAAPMVPLKVSADGREYSFRMVPDPVLTPLLVSYLVSTSHAARGATFGGQTTTVRVELRYVDGRDVALEQSFADMNAPATAAQFAGLVVGYLQNTWFVSPELGSVSVELTTSHEVEQAVIVDAVAERPEVEPGDDLPIRIRLRPRDGDEFSRVVNVRIPDEVRRGRLELIVADGASWTVYDLQTRPSRAASFADELAMLGRLVPSTRVVIALEQKEMGVALQGNGGSAAAPTGVVVNLRTALGSNLRTTAYREQARVVELLDRPVIGALRIPLTVRPDGDVEE